ncbi:glycosyltransferase, partial [bacterium]|nr:glycosyltransferase [bacterium]
YFKTKIGLNMHLSLTPTETGNMRMYEVPAHGMMLLCDKAARDSHELIYKANEEAVFYENFDDAISKVNYYLKNDQERIAIAKNGFNRFKKDYVWEQNLQKFLAWALSIKR